jgi:hypothetical protein
VFESGNERTKLDYSLHNSTVSSAYHLHPTDTFIINNEFQNLHTTEKWVWLSLTYDYINDIAPESKSSKVIWLSIGRSRCGANTVNPFGPSNVTDTLHPKGLMFSEHSIPWTVRRHGLLLGTNGHMHDGGIVIDVFQNNKKICSSSPVYEKAVGMSGMMGMHIDRYVGCEFHPPIPMSAGDSMYLRADYDFTKHDGYVNPKALMVSSRMDAELTVFAEC